MEKPGLLVYLGYCFFGSIEVGAISRLLTAISPEEVSEKKSGITYASKCNDVFHGGDETRLGYVRYFQGI